MTLWPEFEDYLLDLELQQGAAQSTLRSRRHGLTEFSDYCEQNGIQSLESVSRRDVSDYIRYLATSENYAFNTIMNDRYASVGAALRWAYREGRISDSIMERIDKSSMRRLVRREMDVSEKKDNDGPPPHLSKDEVYQLANNVPTPRDRNTLLVKLLFWTGVRVGEARLINMSDINYNDPSIKIYSPKTDDVRTVSYPAAELNPELRDWENNGRLRYKCADTSDRLLLGQKGTISRRRIGEIINEAAEEAGLQEDAYETSDGVTVSKVTPHTLRHSHAMHYLNKKDTDIELISRHLGHSSVTTTEEFYAQSTKESIVDEFS